MGGKDLPVTSTSRVYTVMLSNFLQEKGFLIPRFTSGPKKPPFLGFRLCCVLIELLKKSGFWYHQVCSPLPLVLVLMVLPLVLVVVLLMVLVVVLVAGWC